MQILPYVRTHTLRMKSTQSFIHEAPGLTFCLSHLSHLIYHMGCYQEATMITA